MNTIQTFSRKTRLQVISVAILLIIFTVFLKLLEYPNADRIILLLIVSIVLGMTLGVKGYIYGFLLLVPFSLPPFNISKIPIFGYYLIALAFKERAITFAGMIALPVFLMKLGRFTYLHKPLLLLTIVNISAILVGVEFGVVTGPEYYYAWYSKHILFPSMLFVMIFRYAVNLKTIRNMLMFLLIGNVLFMLLNQIFTPTELGYVATQSGLRYGGFWHLPLGIRVYADPVLLSSYLATSIILSIGFMLMVRNQIIRILLIITITMFLIMIFNTFSRTGFYGMIIGIPLILLLYISKIGYTKTYPKKIMKYIALISIIGVLLIIGFNSMNTTLEGTEKEGYTSRLLTLTSSSSNIYGRFELLSRSIKNSLSHPLGEGIALIQQQTGLNNHCEFAKYLSALGWLGMACLFAFITICIKRVWKATKSDNQEIRKVAITISACLMIFIVMSFGIGILGPMWGNTYFWTLLALGMALGYLDENTRNRGNSTNEWKQMNVG